MNRKPVWEEDANALEAWANEQRAAAAAAAAGAPPAPPAPPAAPAFNPDKQRAMEHNIRKNLNRERQELRRNALVSSKKQLLNYYVGRPDEEYRLEGEARLMGVNDDTILAIKNEILRLREENPNIVAQQAANNALAQEIMNQNNNNNNNGEPNPNLMGGIRRRRRATRKVRKARKTRKGRKNRKTRVRKH
jgi:hypothetical protein